MPILLAAAVAILARPALAAPTGLAAPAPDTIRARVETGSPFHIVDPSYRDGTVVLVLSNHGRTTVTGMLQVGSRLRSSDSVRLEPFGEFVIPAGSEVRRPLPEALLGRRLGMRYVDWRVEAPTVSGGGVTSIAIMQPVGPTMTPDAGDGFIFGIAGGMRISKDAQFKEAYFKAAGLIGCKAVRMDLTWNVLQPRPDVWRWEGLDACVAIAKKNGIFIQPLLAYGNAWALTPESRQRIEQRRRDGTGQPNDDQRMLVTEKAWKGFCAALARRYGTRMQYYEIWNEADMLNFWRGTPEEYLTLLKWGYEAIKAVDPNIIVTTSGFATLKHPRHNPAVYETTFREGGAYFDVIAWHQHHIFPTFHRTLDNNLFPLIRRNGLQDKPIVFNETAVGMDFPQEWELATTLVKKRTFVWSRGAIGHYWYNLTSSAPDMYMLNPDWTPRPSFPAYNELSRQLRGRKFVRQIELGPDRWCFLFNGRGVFQGSGGRDYVAVIWSQDENERGGPLMFKAGEGTRAYEVDLMGNRRQLNVAAGYVTATLTPEPKYIVAEGASVPLEVVTPLLGLPAASRPIVIGEETTVSVAVRNPLPQPAKVDLKWTLPKSLEQIGRAPPAFDLQPGEEKTWTLAVRLPDDPKAALVPVQLAAAVRGQGLKAEATMALLPIRRVKTSAEHDGPPLLVMERADQVINDNNILPNTRHLLWGGRGDLSGKARVYLEGEALVVHVAVTDDKHYQKGVADELLDGDAAQVALAVPGRPDLVELWLGSPDRQRAVPSVRSVMRDMNRAKFEAGLQASVVPRDDGLDYTLKLPLRQMNLQPADLRKGVRVNVAIHDNDGEAKKGFIRAADGIGDALSTARFPLVVFD